MAGIAGEQIAVSAAQPLIAEAVAVVQGTTSARGCTTNFIGFGLGAENTVQTQDTGVSEDFNPTDDTVTLGTAAPADYEPVYTADVLSWAVPTP